MIVIGDKLITNDQDQPMHSGGSTSGKRSIQLLFAEQLTFSLCDYFVISHDSAVGRIGIWLSETGGSTNNTFIEHRNFKLGPDDKVCAANVNEVKMAVMGAQM